MSHRTDLQLAHTYLCMQAHAPYQTHRRTEEKILSAGSFKIHRDSSICALLIQCPLHVHVAFSFFVLKKKEGKNGAGTDKIGNLWISKYFVWIFWSVCAAVLCLCKESKRDRPKCHNQNREAKSLLSSTPAGTCNAMAFRMWALASVAIEFCFHIHVNIVQFYIEAYMQTITWFYFDIFWT